MSLFEQVLGAISNPGQQGSIDGLGSILGAVQGMSSGNGLDANSSQALMSAVGGLVQSALQQQANSQGQGHVEALVNQFGGGGANSDAVGALFPGMENQVADTVSSQTGLNAGMIQSMLPVLIPAVLGLIQQGGSVSNAPADQAVATAGGNPILNMFLDGNRDGNVDVGDAMGMAMQFLNNR